MANATFTTFGSGANRSPLRSVFARLRDWNEVRRTKQALSQLSTHELDDIGLTRGDIDLIAQRRY